MSQYGPYLLEGIIVKRGRPSSTKGSIGCVSLVHQLLKYFIFLCIRILLIPVRFPAALPERDRYAMGVDRDRNRGG